MEKVNNDKECTSTERKTGQNIDSETGLVEALYTYSIIILTPL